MPNTIDSALILDVLKNSAATTLKNRLAPLAAFSRDFGADTLRPRANVVVPIASGASSVQTNPTNFAVGDTTLGAITVTVDQYSKSFHVTNDQAQNGIKLAQLAEVNLAALADKIMDVALAPLSAASASYTGTAADFDANDLQDGWAAIAKSEQKNVILRGDYFAKFLPTNRESFVPGAGAFGFDGFYLNTRWQGSLAGVFAGPAAIALASGVPSPFASNGYATDIVRIDGLGLAVQVNVWQSGDARTLWSSYDVVFGSAAGDLNAAKTVVVD